MRFYFFFETTKWKQYPLMLFCLTLLPVHYSFSQNFSDAVVYNNYVISEQNELIGKSLDYISFSIHSEDYDAIEKKRTELIEHIRKSINKIRKMPPFQGRSHLKNETIEAFAMYLRTYETDLLHTLSLKRKYNNSYEALEAYFKSEAEVENKLNKAITKLGKAQEAFARQNGLIFEKSPMGDIETRATLVSSLSDYSREVFMEYFIVSKAFNDMVAILHERKGNLLDKKRKDVIKLADEGLGRLKKALPFNKDREYLDQTIDIIEYFRNLCQKEFARVATLYDKPVLTEKDADYINKVFNDYNANIEVLVYNWTLANKYLWSNNVGDLP